MTGKLLASQCIADPAAVLTKVEEAAWKSALMSVIGRAEAMLAARGTADGGPPLTTAQAEHFLQVIGASDRLAALYHDNPDETTAMLNNLLTQIEGPFETRLGYILTYMRQV